jgi:biotin operon repressor
MDITCFDWIQIIKKSNLPPNAKYLSFYLNSFMNSEKDMAWPSLKRIEEQTGLSRPTICKHLAILESEGYLIKDKHYGKTNGGDQLHNCYLINIPSKVVEQLYSLATKGSKATLHRGLNDFTKGVKPFTPNNNRITKNNNGRFTPPTLTEIKVYCNEKNSSVDPEKFFYFYESKNWMIGKNKMKSWKSAIATWERSDNRQTNDLPYALGAI